MSDPRDELQRMLAGMRLEYAHALPGKLALIESLWREASAGAARGEDLLRAVHSIAGGAGTFGMAEVGHAARDLEDALRSGKDPAHLDDAFARLREAVQAALSADDLRGPE